MKRLGSFLYRLYRTAPLLLCGSVWLWWAVPFPRFVSPYATVLEDREGVLMGGLISEDEQWRLPPSDEDLNPRFTTALKAYEDKRFDEHCGVDFAAVARAASDNLQQGRVVSGASTLTMQTVRLARNNPPRTFWEKFLECSLAFRLEARASKAQILKLYAAHAPFGGNVVGLEAAAYRYFQRPPRDLSWAEAATLAVLPNQPALVHPGADRGRLRLKRDALLRRLFEAGVLDEALFRLSLLEPLPERPKPLPNLAPHLLQHLYLQQGIHGGGRFTSTLDRHLQERVGRVLSRYHKHLESASIHNAAVLVLDNRDGKVLVYLGNTGNLSDSRFGGAVDLIQAPRSPGSLLKPFLHNAALGAGEILPHTLLPDFPGSFFGYRPKNFDGDYLGAVPADQALAQSRNIPFVHLLADHDAQRFVDHLGDLALRDINQSAAHYGLSIILGGGESRLWDLTCAYASTSRYLQDLEPLGRQFQITIHPEKPVEAGKTHPFQSKAAVFETLEALTHLKRPGNNGRMQSFTSSRKIAWKTGTSMGFRDAWAIGTTPEYTVGVWVGNADGEGRPGLTGVAVAAPILFETFGTLPHHNGWFEKPLADYSTAAICPLSGQRRGRHCPDARNQRIPTPGLRSPTCAYHQTLFLDPDRDVRVSADKVSPLAMRRVSWFILPPRMAWFYRRQHPSYRTPPPWRADCEPEVDSRFRFHLLYPGPDSTVFLPDNNEDGPGEAVFEAAHQDPETVIHWHLDHQYLGSTRHFHQMPIKAEAGPHQITLVDAGGERIQAAFTIKTSTSGETRSGVTQNVNKNSE